MIEGASMRSARSKFNLPAPVFKSHPASPMSSVEDFNICLTSSFVKLSTDKIKAAAAETNGADAEVPL